MPGSEEMHWIAENVSGAQVRKGDMVGVANIELCRWCIEGEPMPYPVIVDNIWWCDVTVSLDAWFCLRRNQAIFHSWENAPEDIPETKSSPLKIGRTPPQKKKHVIFQTGIFQVPLAVSLKDNNSLCF